MAVLLVRHAMALARRKWDGPDEARPLTPRGVRQAERLPKVLVEDEIERILSSPSLRCLDTVRPLGKERSLDVEERPELAEGSTTAALTLIRSSSLTASVMCSHGDVIGWVLQTLAQQDAVDLGPKPQWAKGSTWVLDFEGDRCVAARYIPAPA